MINFEIFFSDQELVILNRLVPTYREGFICFLIDYFRGDEIHVFDMIVTAHQMLIRHAFIPTKDMRNDFYKALDTETNKYKADLDLSGDFELPKRSRSQLLAA